MKRHVWYVVSLWALLTLVVWFGPKDSFSDAERRSLAPLPKLSAETVASGEFMQKFESYSLDRFPLRDSFRRLKALFHYNVLGQKDNNGIYLCDGYAAAQEYPLKEKSVEHAIDRLNRLHEKYLSDSRVVMAIVPDKNYYLARQAGQPHLDYGNFFVRFSEGLPWAEQADLTGVLGIGDYYRTDTHWRQEALIPAAGVLCNALGVTAPKAEDFTVTTLERPFYGVYYGQAALPMEAERICLLESPAITGCTVYDYESGKTLPVYDRTKEMGKDLYEVYLSGPRSLLRIDNPGAGTDRELLIFRDSFGSSIAPLLLEDYATVTLVDLRYLQLDLMDRFLDFHGQDVLILYSTLVLNNGETIK